jgi:quercetin dioxygenase-like cupin family protein
MREHDRDEEAAPPSSNAPGPFECGVLVDLNEQINHLFSATSVKDEAGRKTKMLVKYAEFRIALVTMRSGSRWNDHKTAARISVQVLRGQIRFHTPQGTLILAGAQLLTLDPGIVHSVDAIEDSVFLLTLSDAVSR